MSRKVHAIKDAYKQKLRKKYGEPITLGKATKVIINPTTKEAEYILKTDEFSHVRETWNMLTPSQKRKLVKGSILLKQQERKKKKPPKFILMKNMKGDGEFPKKVKLSEDQLERIMSLIMEAIPRLERRPGEKTSDVIARYFAQKELERDGAKEKQPTKEKQPGKAPFKGRGLSIKFGSSRSVRSSPASSSSGHVDGVESIHSILSRMRALAQKPRKIHRDPMTRGL